MSAALCLSENMLYLKSIQNGNPVIWSYRLSSGEQDRSAINASSNSNNKDYSSYIKDLEEKYSLLESRLKKIEQKEEEKF